MTITTNIGYPNSTALVLFIIVFLTITSTTALPWQVAGTDPRSIHIPGCWTFIGWFTLITILAIPTHLAPTKMAQLITVAILAPFDTLPMNTFKFSAILR